MSFWSVLLFRQLEEIDGEFVKRGNGFRLREAGASLQQVRPPFCFGAKCRSSASETRGFLNLAAPNFKYIPPNAATSIDAHQILRVAFDGSSSTHTLRAASQIAKS